MTISLEILYYVYLVGVLIFLIFTLFNLYHLIRFGGITLVTVVMSTVYIFGAIGILLISWENISQIDWTVGFQANANDWQPH